MSAIFGIHNLSGSPVLRSDLERMTELLAHRGPDRSGIWCSGVIGFGNRLLNTTVESAGECAPLVDDEYVISADARLDNRVDLIEQLSSAGVHLGQASDTELLLAAYKHWGEACAARLLGDFAFAIWDKKRQELFCARDHFGVRPFYFYFDEGRTFVFASEIKAILSVRDVPCELNELRVADHLSEVFEDNESTFYRRIFRLAPAHTLSLNRDRMVKRRYWALDPSRELRLKSNEEYAAAFREIFTEAVRCRMRSDSPVGSMLSGGLDSSSITCVARQLLKQQGSRLHTFSTIFDDVPDCDERQYINAVLAQDGIDPHFINGDRTAPFREIDKIHWHEDQAFFAPNFAMVWTILGRVAERGIKVLLDGHDGDSVVSHGYKYLDELAVAGRWLTLAREIRGLAKHYGESPARLFQVYASYYGVDRFVSKHDSLKHGRRVWRGLKRRFQRDDGIAEPEDWQDLLNSSFAAQTNIAERRRAWRKTLSNSARTERDGHYRTLVQPIQAFALEVHDNAAAAFSIEKRYPFWDRRVVEFCLSLPPEQKMNHGWTRVVMRRAMAGILPKEVQWRGGKMDFTPSLRHALKLDRKLLDSIILHEPRQLENYVNIDTLRRTYKRFLSAESNNSTDVFRIWKCASLALWLRQTWSS